MRADQRNPTIKALRRFKPSKFAATLRDGSTRDLELSTRANKWEILENTINSLPWTRIEALSDGGAVLGCVDAEEDEIIEETEGGIADDVERLTKIMQQVQQSTMVECRRMFADQQRVQGEMAAAMMDSMKVMQESYQMAIKMTAMAGVSSGGEAGEQDKVMQMIQMAMAMKFGTPAPAPSPPPAPRPPPAPSKAIAKPNGA